MANEPVDKQISELPAASTLGENDLLPIQQGQAAKKLSGKKLSEFVYASAAERINEVNQAVADAQEAVDELEEQKNEIAQSVASMAELGTDTTLTTPGMAADAKVVGDTFTAQSDRIGNLTDDLTKYYCDKLSIPLGLSVGDTVTPSPNYSESFSYLLLKVSKGDIITVTARGGTSPKAWCLTDNDYKILSIATGNATDVTLTVSEDGFFISDANINYTRSCVIQYASLKTANVTRTHIVESEIAFVEYRDITSKAYSENNFFIRNHRLNKVTTSIANGGTITINTNVAITTLSEVLTTLLNA